ncbi:MAG: hypothetical protein WC762_02995 [Methylobacter sp.]|jgi:hypothetical protein
MSRIVCWFSCGAASAVATKLAISDNNGKLPIVIAYTEIAEEHQDNKRFLSDCEKWFGQEIIVLRNEKYKGSAKEVYRKERFLVGPTGAACTRLLKRQTRVLFEEEDDYQVFGFTAEENDRASDFKDRNGYVKGLFPLIDRGLVKSDCLAMIEDAGIELPFMYKLGYRNNNCIGCVKGGAGYWNKIRVDFPIVFKEMAEIERELGRSVIRVKIEGTKKSKSLYLDELPVNMGRHQDEPDIECSFFCNMAKMEYAA